MLVRPPRSTLFPSTPLSRSRELREAVAPARTPRGRRIRGTRVRVADRTLLDLPVRIARREFVLPTVASAAPYMRDLDLAFVPRSEEHTSELQSRQYIVCRLL